jgi:hypothetical protein
MFKRQKELEPKVFTFHSIVTCCKTADLTAVSDDNRMWKLLYNPKNKKSFLIPIRGLLNLEQMGTTKVKAFRPCLVAKWMITRNQLMWLESPPMSFYVASVKIEPRKHCSIIPCTTVAFSDEIETLREILKRQSLSTFKIMTLCSHSVERSAYATAVAT